MLYNYNFYYSKCECIYLNCDLQCIKRALSVCSVMYETVTALCPCVPASTASTTWPPSACLDVNRYVNKFVNACTLVIALI